MFRLMTAAFLATALSTAAFSAEPTPMNRTITISGHGEARVVPDIADISLGVSANAPTAREALTANTAAMNALMDTITKAGIAAKDVQTNNFSVNPHMEYDPQNQQPPRITGYDVSNAVTVTVRDVAALGPLLDAAVSAGSNQINSISFRSSKADEVMDEARKEAVKDAQRKAALYTTAAGVGLGNILSMSEAGSAEPRPMFYAKAMRADAAGAVPIAQGEQTLAIDMTMVWEIK
jgi:hypothetical protein